jgi:Anti-sigma-K factor rskA
VMSLLVDLDEDSPALWSRIEEEISGRPDTTNIRQITAAPKATRSPFRRRALALVAAAAALVAGVFVVGELREDGGSRVANRRAEILAAADQARGDPAAREAVLADLDGAVRANVVYLPDGTGYVVDTTLERLPQGRTYQLWALIDDPTGPTAVSAGVLGRDVAAAAFRVDAPVRGFAISTERVPGALAPHEPLAAQGPLA